MSVLIVAGIIISIVLCRFYLGCRYFQVMQYFWAALPDDKKEYVNYIGHKSSFLKRVPWESYKFIEERNAVLLSYDRIKADKLIQLEYQIGKLEAILVFSVVFGLFILIGIHTLK